MTLPNAQQVKDLTRKHVIEADAKDVLHTLTPKVLRRDLETELNLDEGDLDAPEFRSAVKTAIETTMAELGSGKAKKNSDVAVISATSQKSTAKGKKRASDVGITEAPKRKPRANKKQASEDNKPRKRKSSGVNKEASPVLNERTAVESPGSDEDVPTSTKPPQKRRKTSSTARIEDSEDETSKEVESEPQGSKVEAGTGDLPEAESSMELLPTTKEDTGERLDYKSESELSILIDESPKRKRKTKDQDNAKKPNSKTDTKIKKKKSDNLGKDEEKIKKLKALVVACGVRKVWSKVFQGLDTSAQQIKKLREILHELGMTGRMSMEQAKAIKEKREFEQELQDVQDFQKAVMKSGKRRGQAEKEDNTNDTDSGEEDLQPRRKMMNAAQSITAFLGEQSSDDD